MFFFFFNDTATTEIYTLSLHDALPISTAGRAAAPTTTCTRSGPTCAAHRSAIPARSARSGTTSRRDQRSSAWSRSEEHTSELQSRQYLVCRLLLEKKKKQKYRNQLQLH